MPSTADLPRSALLVLAAAVAAVLIAAAVVTGFGASAAWTLVAVLGATYLLGRGASRSAGGRPTSPRVVRVEDRRHREHTAPPPATPDRSSPPPATQAAAAAASPPPEPPVGGPPPVPPASVATPQAEVTLSEEQLRVDRQARPRERVRFVKYVVTEHVTVTVPVRREEIRVERIPLDGPAPPTDGEVLQELTLMEDVPVVDTHVVPRERVSLSADTVTTEQQVHERLRREEIEIDQRRSDTEP